MKDIATPDSSIARHYKRWKRNRDLIEGADAVKQVGAGYLPRLPIHAADIANGDQAYAAYLARCDFFPATSRILEGLVGLIFRKPPQLEAPANLGEVFDTITDEGCTVEDLAERVVEEVLTTNFCALYVDHPAVPEGASIKEVEASGARPFVSLYPAETILSLGVGVVNNQRVINRVGLADVDDLLHHVEFAQAIDPFCPILNGIQPGFVAIANLHICRTWRARAGTA